MTLTTNDIVGLLRSSGLTAGAARYQLTKRRDPHRPLTSAQRAFAEVIAGTRRQAMVTPEHPEAGAIRERYPRPDDAELSAVELAWLERLPEDPTLVRFEDAQRLAAMAASVSSMKAPQSARLVETIWAPVKAVHDKRAAEARLAQARRPLPIVPSEARAALVDSLAEEHQGVSRDALVIEADRILEAVRVQRETQHAVLLDGAQRQVDELAAAQSDYAAVAKERVA